MKSLSEPTTLQGPLLALPVVFFPDTPALQVLCCQTILISYVSLQLLSWPWKAPILNIVDFTTCFLLAVLVMITGFYLPAVTGATLQTIQTCSLFVLAAIFGVVALMMFLTLMALLYRSAIGSQKEWAVRAAHERDWEQAPTLPQETSKSDPGAGPWLVVPCSRIIEAPSSELTSVVLHP